MDCDLRAKESVKTTRRRRADKDLKVSSVPPPPPPVTAPLRRSHRLGLIGGGERKAGKTEPPGSTEGGPEAETQTVPFLH